MSKLRETINSQVTPIYSAQIMFRWLIRMNAAVQILGLLKGVCGLEVLQMSKREKEKQMQGGR